MCIDMLLYRQLTYVFETGDRDEIAKTQYSLFHTSGTSTENRFRAYREYVSSSPRKLPLQPLQLYKHDFPFCVLSFHSYHRLHVMPFAPRCSQRECYFDRSGNRKTRKKFYANILAEFVGHSLDSITYQMTLGYCMSLFRHIGEKPTWFCFNQTIYLALHDVRSFEKFHSIC